MKTNIYIAFPIEIIVTTLAFTYICLFFVCFFLLFCKLCFSHTSWIGKISNKTIVVDIHLFFCLCVSFFNTTNINLNGVKELGVFPNININKNNSLF